MEIWKCGAFVMEHARTARLSLDIPLDWHMHLKMLAARKGISMREYILEALAFKEASEEKESVELDDKTFRKGLARVKKEHAQLAKNLAKR
jgi:hypothetical protein